MSAGIYQLYTGHKVLDPVTGGRMPMPSGQRAECKEHNWLGSTYQNGEAGWQAARFESLAHNREKHKDD